MQHYRKQFAVITVGTLSFQEAQGTSVLFAGKLGRLWQHVRHVQTFCLAQRKQQKSKDQKPGAMYSRAALRDALKWAAAHAPAQLSLKVHIQTLAVCAWLIDIIARIGNLKSDK